MKEQAAASKEPSPAATEGDHDLECGISPKPTMSGSDSSQSDHHDEDRDQDPALSSVVPPPRPPPEAATKEEVEVIPPTDGTGNFLPVLIIPGFMSSGLEVKKSGVSEEWVGLRVWLNLKKLGFKSIQSTGALVENENKQMTAGASDKDRRLSMALHQEYERQARCKSDWLQHVSLSHDMRTEREGMEVRPVEGLQGVDYLGLHEEQFLLQQLINFSTYVFGPVIKVLQKAGYTGNNLDAAPYDWRVPPSILEERDRYFSRTMRKVEELYRKNDGTPVVLLCHSMGCRMAHYFLNFAKTHPDGGEAWLSRHVHTYMPVGAPTLGAPKSLRAMVDGDKMGLDAFLSDEEGLVLGRSLGSGLWLLPTELPPRNAPSNSILRNEGAVHVTVSPIECRDLSTGAKDDDEPPKIRLVIKYGGNALNTSFQQPEGPNAVVTFNEKFMFPAPPSLPLTADGGSDVFQIILLEPGLDRAAKSAQETFCSDWTCKIPLCILKYVFIGLKIVLFGTYLALRRVIKGSPDEPLPSAQDIGDIAIDSGTKLASITLASSGKLNLSEILSGQKQAEFDVKLRTGKVAFFSLRRPREISASVQVKFVPPPMQKEEPNGCSPISPPVKPATDKARHGLKDTTDGCPITNKKNEQIEYAPVGGDRLLLGEGMGYVFDVMRECYDSDPLGPRTLSSKDPPPVGRVKAIYGVNLPTEAGAVYRRKSLFLEDGKLQKLHELDVDAELGMHKGEYQVRRGVLIETKKTPQVILGPNLTAESDIHKPADVTTRKTPLSVLGMSSNLGGSSAVKKPVSEGEVVHRSGDGTVPYWSLQHCRTWQGPCDVSVDEIEGAEHREILANSTFHKILVDYVTQGSARVSVKKPAHVVE